MAVKQRSESVLRLLDANLNRAREGLRVLEDTARFVWNDSALFRKFRAERHGLDLVTRKFYPELLRSRDSRNDEGRVTAESGRNSVKSVVAANFRRCEESLRVLEEYGKVFAKGAAKEFKRMRFGIYTLEKKTMELKGKRVQ